jgi:hypothetical protein
LGQGRTLRVVPEVPSRAMTGLSPGCISVVPGQRRGQILDREVQDAKIHDAEINLLADTTCDGHRRAGDETVSQVVDDLSVRRCSERRSDSRRSKSVPP